MYQVIATKKSDEGKQVKAFWVVKEYKTHNAAQKRMIKMREQNNQTYNFDLNLL